MDLLWRNEITPVWPPMDREDDKIIRPLNTCDLVSDFCHAPIGQIRKNIHSGSTFFSRPAPRGTTGYRRGCIDHYTPVLASIDHRRRLRFEAVPTGSNRFDP